MTLLRVRAGSRAVLREIKNVRQERGGGRRRWFESDGFDLVVWFDACDEIAGFQICYDLGRGEHALTWRPGAGFVHSEVDGGERDPFSNLTPILVRDGEVPWPQIVRQFDTRSESLEPGLRGFVREQLAGKAGRD